MDEFCKYEEYDKYDKCEEKKEDKKEKSYKKDECGEIKIYTHAVHIHINCKDCKH